MCLSRLGQIIYGLLAFATVALIATAMFTPGWRSFTGKISNATDDLQNGKLPSNINIGIFFCSIPNATNNNNNNDTKSTTYSKSKISNTTGEKGNFINNVVDETVDYCKTWWDNLQMWEQIVIVGMVLALGTALLSFLWNFIAFCACFCKGGITKPLPGLAGLTFIILAVSLGTFYNYNQDYIQQLKIEVDSNNLTKSVQKEVKGLYDVMLKMGVDENSKVSYSFYLGCGAAIAAFVNMIVGSLIVCLSDKCL